MPFYEYQCSACGRVSEVMQKFSDPPLRKCPNCGKAKLQKLVSAPVFRLKGSGWYETDFKGDKDNKRNLVGAEKEPEAAPVTDKQAETKTETKDEAAKPADSKAPDSKSEAAAKPKGKPVSRRATTKKAPAKKPARRR